MQTTKGATKDENMRTPKVNRTIKGMELVVLAVNVKDEKMVTLPLVLSKQISDERALLKAAEKLLNSPEIKVIAIKEKKNITAKFTMELQDYIQLAKRIS